MTKRINLISGPRNISTALMYSFANREDTKVVDEPMYAYFLNLTGDDHPAKEEIIDSQPKTMSGVKKELLFNKVDKPIYFIKGMAKHYVDIDLSFLLDLDNVFLIRDPAQLIHSFQKVIPNPVMSDLGLKLEWEIFSFLLEQGKEAIVIDSNIILSNPRKELDKLCEKLEIPFSDKMLKWDAGPIPEDGIWAPYWYAKVHQSTQFGKPNFNQPKLASSLQVLLNESYVYYNKLKEFI